MHLFLSPHFLAFCLVQAVKWVAAVVIHNDGMVNVALTEATLPMPDTPASPHTQRCNQSYFITSRIFRPFSMFSRNYRLCFSRIGGSCWGRGRYLVEGALCIFTVTAVQLLIGGQRCASVEHFSLRFYHLTPHRSFISYTAQFLTVASNLLLSRSGDK
jgi:hypothetical protein